MPLRQFPAAPGFEHCRLLGSNSGYLLQASLQTVSAKSSKYGAFLGLPAIAIQASENLGTKMYL
jgi:hypothetical protein